MPPGMEGRYDDFRCGTNIRPADVGQRGLLCIFARVSRTLPSRLPMILTGPVRGTRGAGLAAVPTPPRTHDAQQHGAAAATSVLPARCTDNGAANSSWHRALDMRQALTRVSGDCCQINRGNVTEELAHPFRALLR